VKRWNNYERERIVQKSIERIQRDQCVWRNRATKIGNWENETEKTKGNRYFIRIWQIIEINAGQKPREGYELLRKRETYLRATWTSTLRSNPFSKRH
jgi:hypothetical protein